jgi:hypothetical protein
MKRRRVSQARTYTAHHPSHPADERLETVLNSMTLDELNGLVSTLHQQLRDGLPPITHLAAALEHQNQDVASWLLSRETREDAVKVVMLLGALSVATAWMTFRRTAAPEQRLQYALATVSERHVYLLPIPRHHPCFCGSGVRFRGCHGKPPAAAIAI